MVLPEDKYAVIRLNLPPVEQSNAQICDVLHNKLFHHFTQFGQQKNSTVYKSLFQKFKNGNDEKGIKEPILDPNRFHCEDLLGVFKYRQSKNHLAKKIKTAPTTTKRLLQYVVKGAEDIAKMIGGEDMMVIYSSLLVSKPGGVNQAFHEDVHEDHAPGQTVYAMIISLSDHTSVDADLGHGKEISVAIPQVNQG